MRYERSDVGLHGWRVFVDADEVRVASGKTVPYPTRIGFIEDGGKIHLWTPAAYVPRGYPAPRLDEGVRIMAEPQTSSAGSGRAARPRQDTGALSDSGDAQTESTPEPRRGSVSSNGFQHCNE